MKSSAILTLLLSYSGLLVLVAGWSKEGKPKDFISNTQMVSLANLASLTWSNPDHEIFRLRDEIVAAEGTDVTFYGMYQ